MLSFFDSNKKTILFIIFLVSFVLRVGFTYNDHMTRGTSYWSDAKAYLSYGISFSHGNIYPPRSETQDYINVGPIVPLMVAVSNILFGDPIWPFLLFNCLITALIVYVLFCLGHKTVGLYNGYFLAMWGAFNFEIIRRNFQVVKEPLLLILIPIITLCLVNIYKKRQVFLNTVLSSVLFSILIHTDERFFVYAPIFLVYLLFVRYPKINLKKAVLWLSILLITMIPWTVRNYRQFGELVILSPRTTAFTSKLWGTNFANLHFSSEEGIDAHIERRKERAQEVAEKYGVELRRYGKLERYYRASVHYWKPTYFRVTFIQSGYRPVKWSLAHNVNSIIFYGIFLPFYVVGVVMAFKKRNWLMLFLWSLPFVHGLLHTVMIWPLERYRLPMNFLVVLVALWVIKEIIIYFRGRRGMV